MRVYLHVFVLIAIAMSGCTSKYSVGNLKEVFPELSSSSIGTSCNDYLGNRVFYFKEELSDISARSHYVRCPGEGGDAARCNLESSSAIVDDLNERALSVSYSPPGKFISWRDDYENDDVYVSILESRKSSKLSLIEHQDGKKFKLFHEEVISTEPIVGIARLSDHFVIHYGECECRGAETIYHSGNDQVIGMLGQIYFTYDGCESIFNEIYKK